MAFDVKEQLQKAWAFFEKGELDAAANAYRACLDHLCAKQHDPYCAALMGLVYTEATAERFEAARRYAQMLLAAAETQEETHVYLHQCGMVERMAGCWAAATGFFEKERALLAADDAMSASANAYEIGYIALKQGDLSGAEKTMRAALAYGEQAGDDMCVGCACRGLGEIVQAGGRKDEALRWFERSIAAFQAAGDAIAADEVREMRLKIKE